MQSGLQFGNRPQFDIYILQNLKFNQIIKELGNAQI